MWKERCVNTGKNLVRSKKLSRNAKNVSLTTVNFGEKI